MKFQQGVIAHELNSKQETSPEEVRFSEASDSVWHAQGLGKNPKLCEQLQQ